MFILAVTPSLRYLIPAICFYNLDYVSHFHDSLLYLSGTYCMLLYSSL